MLELKLNQLPEFVREMPGAPKQLFCEGADLLEILKLPRVAIVGSRKPTTYGRQITEQLASKLAEQGVVIISGLAYGIDAIAHQAALEVGGAAIAVLPSPLDNIIPTAHLDLAEEITSKGGVLLSEYPSGVIPFKQNFIARNRLMSGLADVVIVTEAAEKSGALHTANFALEQGRDVMAVPGNIYSPMSRGCNNLIKSGQAQLVTSYQDVLDVLGLNDHVTPARQVRGRNQNEQAILDLMLQGISEGDQLLSASGIDTSKFNQSLTMLEISGKIRPLGGNHWAIT